MSRATKNLTGLLLLIAFITGLQAQSAHWDPDNGTLAFGQTSQLQLVFDGCAPKGQPSLPSVDGLSLQFAGNSSQTSIVNGTVSRTEILTYAARPTKRADVTIPEFSIETDKGRVNVASASYSVGAATVGGNVSLESVATSNFNIPATVWAGEVFPIEYNLNVRKRNIYSLEGLLGSLLDWKPTALILEEWPKPAAREAQINGEPFITVYQNTRASITKPGTVTLPEGNQLVNITTGSAGLGFFARQNLEQFAIASNKPTINVRPLPTNAPSSFNGAVGQFTLKSNVVPATTNVGEPITWTLTLTGTGNWPSFAGLPSRSVSKDFRAVQPQAKRTPKEGSLFDASLVEDVVLIPTKPGSYTLGPVTWSYFDPAKGEYQTITTPATTVSVAPAAEIPPPAAATAVTAPAVASSQPKPPAMPKGIPRDPLPEEGEVPAPLDQNTFIAWLSAPFAVFILFWVWLAFRRARVTDPARPRREAKARALATIETLRSTQAEQQAAALLLAWQKDVAALWETSAAVPAANLFPAGETKWITLWTDAERTLYRDATPLPPDWANRATEALQQHHVPGFSFFQLFRIKNLLPFAAVIAVGLALANVSLQAADAKASYDRGDFAAAEKAWRSVLTKTPGDPAAHHNLSLAIAQQDRWGEAAAHAAAAFAQQPSNAAIRWNLAFAMERASFASSVFSGFTGSHPAHQLAGLLSVTQWQYAAVLASALTALACGLLLLRSYGRRTAGLKIAALTLFAISTLLGTAAIISLRVYSPLHDIRAAIVWRTTTLRSIPTEVETSQKTSPLSAGTVAIVDNNFIGKTWAHLSFSNGQTGWIRSEDLVPIWK